MMLVDIHEFVLELQKELADKHGVAPESIVITGGSNEVLRVTGLAISNKGNICQANILGTYELCRSLGR